MAFEDYLEACEAEDTGASLEDVYIFCTGAVMPPPMGLGRPMKLRFTHSGVLPTSSTCSVTLTLPTKLVNDQKAFFDNLSLGFKSNNFFWKSLSLSLSLSYVVFDMFFIGVYLLELYLLEFGI
eukprot:m.272882 g.272882  ORF g.272882 m.272882 type:complete len:123 (+) comp40568_c0_seq12:2609-2977(+)